MAGTDTEKKPVLEMVQADGADEGCVTFVLHEEDHTLGNSLRYMITKNPEVEFCGYSITHPSESKINFRIQTRGGLPATEPLRKGLNELTDVCKHVLHTFELLYDVELHLFTLRTTEGLVHDYYKRCKHSLMLKKAQVKDFREQQGEAME